MEESRAKSTSDADDPVAAENEGPAAVLDLTSCQLHDLSSVDLPPTLTELDLTANRLTSLDPRIGQLSNLIKLSLRQNLIDDDAAVAISGWEALSGLEVFDSFLFGNLKGCGLYLYMKVFRPVG